jgi:hypothetical protein
MTRTTIQAVYSNESFYGFLKHGRKHAAQVCFEVMKIGK